MKMAVSGWFWVCRCVCWRHDSCDVWGKKCDGGVRKDMMQVIGWYEKSANAGYAPVLTRLGRMRLPDRGMSRDDGMAIAFPEQSAQCGDWMANFVSG